MSCAWMTACFTEKQKCLQCFQVTSIVLLTLKLQSVPTSVENKTHTNSLYCTEAEQNYLTVVFALVEQ